MSYFTKTTKLNLIPNIIRKQIKLNKKMNISNKKSYIYEYIIRIINYVKKYKFYFIIGAFILIFLYYKTKTRKITDDEIIDETIKDLKDIDNNNQNKNLITNPNKNKNLITNPNKNQIPYHVENNIPNNNVFKKENITYNSKLSASNSYSNIYQNNSNIYQNNSNIYQNNSNIYQNNSNNLDDIYNQKIILDPYAYPNLNKKNYGDNNQFCGMNLDKKIYKDDLPRNISPPQYEKDNYSNEYLEKNKEEKLKDIKNFSDNFNDIISTY